MLRKILQNRSSFRDHFIDNDILPSAMSTGEEEKGYSLGQEFLSPEKFLSIHKSLEDEVAIPEKGKDNKSGG